MRYVLPQRIRRDRDVSLFLRVTQPFGKVKFTVSSGDAVLASFKRSKAAPGEMERLNIPAVLLEKAGDTVTVALEEEK